MRVLVLLTYGYSLKTWENSGTLDRELEIYKQLKEKHKIEFVFLTYGDFKDYKFISNIDNSKIIPVYNKLKYHENPILRYITSFYIPFKFAKEIKDCDIIHQHQLLGSWVACLIKILWRKPLYIRTGYDMYTFAVKENKSFFIKLLYKFLTIFSIKFANIYTVTSLSDKSLFPKNNKVRIRPNWVYEHKMLNSDIRLENKILSVGRLEIQKNFEFLIKEMANVNKKLTLVLVGKGQLKRSLINQSKKLNLEIEIIDKLNHKELHNFYKKFKFYISCSTYEGNPKAILEAQAAGCIVLASKIPNHEEIIKDSETGYLFKLETGELNKLIDKLLSDSQVNHDKISTNSVENVRKNNSIELLVRETYSDYIYLNKS